MNQYDVIIVGGGVSGTVAAIAAGRCKAKVLLIESQGCLGGSLTSCGVGPMMTFHTGMRQITKGILDEIVQSLAGRRQSAGHVRDPLNCVPFQVPFNSEGLKVLLDEMTEKANVDVLFHTTLASASVDGNRVTEVKVCNKAGLSSFHAKVFIDATGDADLAVFSGVKTTHGSSYQKNQPMTMNMKYCNVDSQKLREDVIKLGPKEFPSMFKNISVMENSRNLAVSGYFSLFKKAKERGELSIPREDLLIFETERSGEYIINTTRITDLDPVDPFDLSKAEAVARKQCRQLDAFLHKYIPAFKNAMLEFTGPNIGVRSSRQIVGHYTVTRDDLFSFKKFDDVICHGAYPIDIHSSSDGTTHREELNLGEYYSIPYSSLYTDQLSNLLVCGRCLSATFEAQSALRLTPLAAGTGQAAGVAAALASETDSYVQDVDVRRMQNILKDQGVELIL